MKSPIRTKRELERFIELACLSEDDIFILETRVKGWGVSRQAMALHCSESTVHKRIAEMKRKYDIVQKDDDILPPRKKSKKEEWMDTH